MSDETAAEQRQIEAAKQDPNAFAPLYASYFDPIYRYCYLRLHHRELAADAASKTFLKAFASIGGFRSGSFKSWLYAIARNVTSDMLRASRPQADLSHAELIPDSAPSPEEHALRADDQEHLWAALSMLTDDQREVMELRLAGLTGAEIAEATSRSLAATKSIQYRALSRLRTLLEMQMLTDGATQ